MALTFGDDVSSNYSNSALPASYKGIRLYEHGGNLGPSEATSFMNTLGDLVNDYPMVSAANGGQLDEIHLHHSLDVFHKEGSTPDAQLDDLSVEGTAGIAGAKRSFPNYMTGEYNPEGSIGINVQELREGSRNVISAFTSTMQEGKRLASDSIDRVLTHEFGHHVQYTAALKYDWNQIETGMRSEAEHNRDSMRELGVPDASVEEGIHNKIAAAQKNEQYKQVLSMDAHHQLEAMPLFQKHFGIDPLDPSGLAEAGEAIGSAYGGSSPTELFAETFTRGRLGSGPGAAQAGAFERELRVGMSRSEKMAANSRNTGKMLSTLRKVRRLD